MWQEIFEYFIIFLMFYFILVRPIVRAIRKKGGASRKIHVKQQEIVTAPSIVPDSVDIVVTGMRRQGEVWYVKIGTRGKNRSTTEYRVRQNSTQKFNGVVNGVSFVANVYW